VEAYVALRSEIVPLVARKSVPVAEVNASDVIVPFPIVPFVAKKFVANKCVDVVFVPVALVHTIPERLNADVSERLPIVAFVALNVLANRFVEVAFVLVTFPNTPLKRSEPEPRERPMSDDGVMNPPDAKSVRLPSVFEINPSLNEVPVPATNAPFVYTLVAEPMLP
jgi:hypothetical protein